MHTQSLSNLRSSLSAVVLAVASLALAPHAHAQSPAVKVAVPFAFEYGSRNFRPGVYTLRVNADRVLLIEGRSSSGAGLTIPDIDPEPAARGKVVFDKAGSRYFLRQVWTAGASTHVHCVKSKAEKQAEEQLASNSIAPSSVQLALMESPH